MTLLEASRRKCDFLERWTDEVAERRRRLGPGRVAAARDLRRGSRESARVPPTAVEWCLPLVREGGAVVLWVGPTADPAQPGLLPRSVAGRLEQELDGLLVIRKTGPTPPGFPRKAGIAKKRPLG